MTQTNLTDSPPTLLQQFEQWATLEPDRCSVSKFEDGRCFTLSIDNDAVAWYLLPSALKAMEKAVLQACLQEAIAARDWGFELTYNLETKVHRAQILEDADDEDFWHRLGLFSAEEPAIALLTAYLQALQAARSAA